MASIRLPDDTDRDQLWTACPKECAAESRHQEYVGNEPLVAKTLGQQERARGSTDTDQNRWRPYYPRNRYERWPVVVQPLERRYLCNVRIHGFFD